MNRTTITRLAAATVATAVAITAPAAGAGKQRVVVDRFSGPFAGSVDCADYGPYDFTNEYAGHEKVTVTEVLSRDGDLLQTVFHINLAETETNSETGASLSMKGAVHEVWDYADNTRTISGKVWLGTQAGSGPFIQETGRIAMTLDGNEPIFVAGPHDAFFEGGIDFRLCAALDAAT